jgi:hypothetical protein
MVTSSAVSLYDLRLLAIADPQCREYRERGRGLQFFASTIDAISIYTAASTQPAAVLAAQRLKR